MLRPRELRELLKKLDGKAADAIESETLECKPWNPNPAARDSETRGLRETVVCLANCRGGSIVLGVADGKRTRREAIQGVGTLDVPDLRRRIYDGTDPHILVEIDELAEPEGRILLIHVPRGIAPHLTTEGVGKIRMGKECKPLKGSDLARLLMSRGQRDMTAEPIPEASIQDLDPSQIELLRRTILAEAQNKELAALETRELLQNLGLIREGEVTLAAVLLLGTASALARWAPNHEVIFLRFKTATRYDLRRDMKGPLLALLQAVRELLIERHLQLDLVQTEGFAELSIPDISWQVAREAALNALTHRDYFLNQSVYLNLHRDRLEVSSPGGFVGGITPENILRHPPVRRNTLLADVFQTIGLVNRAGLGVDRIFEELLSLGKGLPRYSADEGQVSVVLPLKTHHPFARFMAAETKEGRSLDLNDLIVLRGVMERGSLDRWSAAELLQLPEEKAHEQLISLRDRRYLVAQGRGRGTAYRLVAHFSDLLRGPGATDLDIPLDDEAIRLRVQAVLRERGRLSNADVRRISGYSRLRVLRLMRSLCGSGIARLEGRGRSAHYVPSPGLAKDRKSKKESR
jgi:ATP-dependent DNA helicase RecG